MRITLYDKNREFTGQIGAPLALTVTPRVYPLIGTALMTVQTSSPQAAKLRVPGARVVFERDGEHLLSGPVDAIELATDSDSMEVVVVDDSVLLNGILGWQVPTSAITSQGGAEYRTYSGPAENVVKSVVKENGVNRLKIPGLRVAPSQGRGASIPGGTTYRMHPVPDRIYPGLDLAGIGVQLRQVGNELVFDVYVPRLYPTTLSVESRTIRSARHHRRRPQASRAVIGGPGEARGRRYRAVTDTAREAQWGFTGETFRDARDLQPEEGVTSWTEVDAQMDARGRETLAENGVVDGLSVTLSESSIFTYGAKGVLVGDIVPVNIHGTVVTDTVKEAVIKWVTPNYSSAEPSIGEQTDPATRQAKTLADLKTSQRKEERA